MLTRKERSAIFQYYSGQFWEMKITLDERVFAKQRRGSPWGLLYTPKDTDKHLKAVGMRGRLEKSAGSARHD